MYTSQEDPSNWKWGIFYYNKMDKRIFLPKIYGLGWTVNFANPCSILILFGIVLVMMLISKYLR
jgi:uncharacterized membrane protein